MPFGYPVMLQLEGRRAVVIGEGAVREGKPEALLAGGAARVLVVAVTPAARLDELEPVAGVSVERRAWRPEDLRGATICVAWSGRADVRAAIAREARARGVLVNVMDDVPHCDFAAPAVVRRGELLLASYGEHWAEIVEILRVVRESTSPLLPDLPERSRRWRSALDLREAEALVLAGRGGELGERLRQRLLRETPGVRNTASQELGARR
jgi:siroheme synthase-like protein